MGDDEARIARTEAVFRDVNERIAETAARFDSEHAEFVCECADAGCTERVAVSLPDYESVRSEPTYFVLAAGHSLGPPLERVVVDRPGYQIVEKIERALREHVKRLDPRAEPA